MPARLRFSPAAALVTAAVACIAAAASAAPAQPAPGGDGQLRAGERIWKQDCAYCHGSRAEGTFQGPPIAESGTGLVDFMVQTGRMPPRMGPTAGQDLFEPGPVRDAPRRPPAYDPDQIDALVAYVSDFITGPPVPAPPDLAGADLARGGELYRLNCAACHQMAGSGGALAHGTVGPALGPATPTQVVEAMRAGPGTMPVFPETALDVSETRDIVAYVEYLDDPADPGGFALWHIGPVGEGLVALLFGLGAALLLCRWLGQREPVNRHAEPGVPPDRI